VWILKRWVAEAIRDQQATSTRGKVDIWRRGVDVDVHIPPLQGSSGIQPDPSRTRDGSAKLECHQHAPKSAIGEIKGGCPVRGSNGRVPPEEKSLT
jgi:hypothetical protein